MLFAVVHAVAPNAQSFVDAAKAFIGPIFMLVVGVVALSFLFKRQLTQFFQFFALVILIGILFYVPGIIESFATWASGLFFGGTTPA